MDGPKVATRVAAEQSIIPIPPATAPSTPTLQSNPISHPAYRVASRVSEAPSPREAFPEEVFHVWMLDADSMVPRNGKHPFKPNPMDVVVTLLEGGGFG